MAHVFQSTITTQAQLRALMGDPVHPVVVAKTLPALDGHCRSFIARSPFVLIASADGAGRMDISPRGDPAGFVQVLDDRALAIPDRPGNQRFDTLRNLIDNPRIGLIFLIPGKRETLRVSGTAQIVTDQSLRDSMAINGKDPAMAIVVDVEERSSIAPNAWCVRRCGSRIGGPRSRACRRWRRRCRRSPTYLSNCFTQRSPPMRPDACTDTQREGPILTIK